MRLTFRSKLLLIVGAASVAFALVIAVSGIFGIREERSLELLEETLVPRLELGPQLEGDLAQLTRGMQDAAAAQDPELLERAAVPHARLLARLRGQTPPSTPGWPARRPARSTATTSRRRRWCAG